MMVGGPSPGSSKVVRFYFSRSERTTNADTSTDARVRRCAQGEGGWTSAIWPMDSCCLANARSYRYRGLRVWQRSLVSASLAMRCLLQEGPQLLGSCIRHWQVRQGTELGSAAQLNDIQEVRGVEKNVSNRTFNPKHMPPAIYQHDAEFTHVRYTPVCCPKPIRFSEDGYVCTQLFLYVGMCLACII